MLPPHYPPLLSGDPPPPPWLFPGVKSKTGAYRFRRGNSRSSATSRGDELFSNIVGKSPRISHILEPTKPLYDIWVPRTTFWEGRLGEEAQDENGDGERVKLPYMMERDEENKEDEEEGEEGEQGEQEEQQEDEEEGEEVEEEVRELREEEGDNDEEEQQEDEEEGEKEEGDLDEDNE
ncbi:hypothetical protein BDK51DRAFT_26543 [Blyttiomyces helicus]|uniref:Uncharacterized protein n=1 Tax=Blyttiomyces helicus TaxID=388810 RepID=A0A4P9WJ80_9FUNG|nr:hypothetical protein BDK51DRAFT_26543 [Blyttiomyces helicus]|eukprot:RKO92971.1 hypothetical protein BDK51DRAFT_26543 [Blyttiomyces helicus]